jgi:hypothetical protein
MSIAVTHISALRSTAPTMVASKTTRAKRSTAMQAIGAPMCLTLVEATLVIKCKTLDNAKRFIL